MTAVLFNLYSSALRRTSDYRQSQFPGLLNPWYTVRPNRSIFFFCLQIVSALVCHNIRVWGNPSYLLIVFPCFHNQRPAPINEYWQQRIPNYNAAGHIYSRHDRVQTEIQESKHWTVVSTWLSSKQCRPCLSFSNKCPPLSSNNEAQLATGKYFPEVNVTHSSMIVQLWFPILRRSRRSSLATVSNLAKSTFGR